MGMNPGSAGRNILQPNREDVANRRRRRNPFHRPQKTEGEARPWPARRLIVSTARRRNESSDDEQEKHAADRD